MAGPSNTTLPSGSTFLVGDVGGTRTRLMVYDAAGQTALAEAVLPSQDFASLEDAVERFMADSKATRPTAAAFGVAGPVRDGKASITNLPWELDENHLAARLAIPRVHLANDLVAIARGCLDMSENELTVLTPSAPARKGLNVGVIAAGTGLGEARLVWSGDRHLVLPTEGGHTDYAPQTPVELELWRFLSARYPDHVSYERVLSGAGLGTLYDFFVERHGGEPAETAAKLATGDRNARIAELGLAGLDPSAHEAVDLFVFIYGAQAGNIALRELAMGGIYVAGNIGHTLIPRRRAKFMEGFLKKGRFAGLLASVPVAVVSDPFVGLRGALAMARTLVGT